MRSVLVTTLSLGMVLAFGAGTASAQYGPNAQSPYGPLYRPGLYPSGTPGLSPYLDLTRGGNVAANYFLGTIPEFQRRSNAAQFGAAIQDLERRGLPLTETTANDLVPTLPGTGHPVAFQSYYPYYLLGARPGQAARQQQQSGSSSAHPR